MNYNEQAKQRRNRDSKQFETGLLDGLIALLTVFVTLAVTHYL